MDQPTDRGPFFFVEAAPEQTLSRMVDDLMSKDNGIAVPTIVFMSLIAFIAIISLSWLMDGRARSSDALATDPTTPMKEPKLGLTVTPAGRRSTRKSHKPEILDPSQVR